MAQYQQNDVSRPMWMVQTASGWQPASSDDHLVDWVRRGYVGPNTLIQHVSWSHPVPLGQVPNFAALFHVSAQTRAARPIDTATTSVLVGFGAIIVAAIVAVLGSFWGTVGIVVMLATGLAGAAVLFGRVAGGAPRALRSFSTSVTRRPALFSVAYVAIMVGGAVGFAIHRGRADECVRSVSTIEMEIRSLPKGTPLDEATKRLDDFYSAADRGDDVCFSARMTSEEDELGDVRREIRRLKKAAQDEAARLEEMKEKQASAAAIQARVDGWPLRVNDIKAQIQAAISEANTGRYLDSDASLGNATETLEGFRGTTIEVTDQWLALAKMIDTQRQRIQPQMDRIRQREAANRQKEEAAISQSEAAGEVAAEMNAAVRGDKSSDLDLECEATIRAHLNDPSSFESASASEPQIEGLFWTVTVTFRAKNGYGALVLDEKKCFIQKKVVVRIE